MGYPTFANKIDQCMSDGTGKIVDKLDSSFSMSFDQINVIAQGTLSFNDKIASFTSDNMDAPFSSADLIVGKV